MSAQPTTTATLDADQVEYIAARVRGDMRMARNQRDVLRAQIGDHAATLANMRTHEATLNERVVRGAELLVALGVEETVF